MNQVEPCGVRFADLARAATFRSRGRPRGFNPARRAGACLGGFGLALLPILLLAAGCAEAPVEPELLIVNVLNDQADAWNRGDLNGFMRHYRRSPDLTFSSGGQTTRGWEETLARYHRRYPDASSMGRLEFDRLEIHPLGPPPPQAALVLGRWRLQHAAGSSAGMFSLVLQRIDGRWVIVHDHTSAAPAAESQPTNAP